MRPGAEVHVRLAARDVSLLPRARSRVRLAFLLLGSLLLAGTLGFRTIERWTWLESFYMTVITLGTVGYSEVRPLTAAGKIFTSALILVGVGSLAYAATRATEAVLEAGVFRRRRMLMEIRKLTGHVVVCGYGRMGRSVVAQLAAHGAAHAVVEKDPARLAELESEGIPAVEGDATEDGVLAAAGVERARALATVLPHDADNLFVTVTARSMNRDMCIVARAAGEKSRSKLLSAGATRVFNPYSSGGRLLARQLLHPSVTEFLDLISRGETDLSLEEVEIGPRSPLAGLALRDSPIRREMDVIVVGVRRPGQELEFNPPPDLAPASGDVLVVLGRRENLQRLARLAGGDAA